MEEQRITNSDAVELGHNDMRIGRVAKQRFIERIFGCDHFVGELFVVGEFFDKAQNSGCVISRCCAQRKAVDGGGQ